MPRRLRLLFLLIGVGLAAWLVWNAGLQLKQRGLSTPAAYAAVVTEYLAYTAASSCLGILAIVLLLSRHLLPQGLRALAVLIAILMGAFVAAFTFASASRVGLIVPILQRFRPVLGRRRAELVAREFGPVEDVIIGFLHGRPQRLAAVIALEAAAQVVLIVEMRSAISNGVFARDAKRPADVRISPRHPSRALPERLSTAAPSRARTRS